MNTGIATLQTIWDCRWSRLGCRLHGVERQHTEPPWACVRYPGQRRPVTDQECEECEFWETRDPDVAASNR